MKKGFAVFVVVVFALAVLAGWAAAAVPARMNVQGRILTAAGTPPSDIDDIFVDFIGFQTGLEGESVNYDRTTGIFNFSVPVNNIKNFSSTQVRITIDHSGGRNEITQSLNSVPYAFVAENASYLGGASSREIISLATRETLSIIGGSVGGDGSFVKKAGDRMTGTLTVESPGLYGVVSKGTYIAVYGGGGTVGMRGTGEGTGVMGYSKNGVGVSGGASGTSPAIRGQNDGTGGGGEFLATSGTGGYFNSGSGIAGKFESSGNHGVYSQAPKNYFSGKVGIGSANPAERLSVAGTIEITAGGYRFADGTVQTTAAGTGAGIFVKKTGDKMTGDLTVEGKQLNVAGEGGTLRLVGGDQFGAAYVDATGYSNVLYVQSASASKMVIGSVDAGNSKVTVAGTVEIKSGGLKFSDGTIQNTSANVSNFVKKTGDKITGKLTVEAEGGLDVAGEGGRMTLQGADQVASGYIGAGGQSGALILQLAGGKVGIGTSNPSAGLDVNGNIRAVTNSAGAAGYFKNDRMLVLIPVGIGVHGVGSAIGVRGEGIIGLDAKGYSTGLSATAESPTGYSGLFSGGKGLKVNGEVEVSRGITASSAVFGPSSNGVRASGTANGILAESAPNNTADTAAVKGLGKDSVGGVKATGWLGARRDGQWSGVMGKGTHLSYGVYAENTYKNSSNTPSVALAVGQGRIKLEGSTGQGIGSGFTGEVAMEGTVGKIRNTLSSTQWVKVKNSCVTPTSIVLITMSVSMQGDENSIPMPVVQGIDWGEFSVKVPAHAAVSFLVVDTSN
ncbi:MAG: hypothetical protein WC529_04605 [Candidatus Margulisiibacteriota bacterium]